MADPAASPRPRRWRRPWSLRSRLVAILAVTVTLLAAGIAAIALVALRGSLVEQLQSELTALASRVLVLTTRPGGAPSLEAAFGGPGAVPGTIAIAAQGTSLVGGYLDADYTLQWIGQGQLSQIVDAWDGSPYWSADLGQGFGRYLFSVDQQGGVSVLVGLPLSGVDATVSRLTLIIGLVGVGGILLLGILAAIYIRHALRPLERVAAAAERVAAMPLDRGEVDLGERVDASGASPGSEAGRLVEAFNAMLARLGQAFGARHASEAKVRRFVADASHELRTPLASIRGYSELTRRMAEDLPADAVYALGRIESESVRMTSLVEDLLLLARLDEGREIESHPVELGGLVADAVNDARAAGPEHRWRYAEPAEPVVVLGDAARVQQVVVNLLANARVHTPAGTTVTVTLEREGEEAVLTVADDGPGIAPEALPTLFERFARADASRARTTGSTGLGLAIVKAVVSAHGGTVTVESEPGDTRFLVRLPAITG